MIYVTLRLGVSFPDEFIVIIISGVILYYSPSHLISGYRIFLYIHMQTSKIVINSASFHVYFSLPLCLTPPSAS